MQARRAERWQSERPYWNKRVQSGLLIVRVPRRLPLITKEEIHVLQEVIAKQCQLIVPCAVAAAALYEVENYRLKQMDDQMVTLSGATPNAGIR
jgi:hypothetical protein